MKRTSALLIALALLAPVFAGCLGVGGEDSTNTEQGLDSQQKATVSSSTGGIEGVVTDAAIQAIANVTVTVEELGESTTSAQDGSFAFSEITPGSYTLSFEKTGFITAERDVDVTANEVSTIELVIAHKPTIEPYIQQFKFDGFLECSASTPAIALAVCSVPNDATQLLGFGNATNDRFIFYHPVEPDPWQMTTELTWDASNPTADSMLLPVEVRGYSNSGDATFSDGQGGDPMVQVTDRERFAQVADNFAQDCEENGGNACSIRPVEAQFPLQIRVFIGGLEPVETFLFGTGVAIQEEFTVFNTVFYHAPASCDDYSVVEDNRCEQLAEPPEDDPYEGSINANNSSGNGSS